MKTAKKAVRTILFLSLVLLVALSFTACSGGGSDGGSGGGFGGGGGHGGGGAGGDEGVNGTFSISDLAGTWKLHSLATNGASSGWEIGDLSIDDTGNFTVNWEDSDGDTGTDTGQLSITNGGTITDFGVGKFQGIMGLDKNIFVGNDTWDDEAVLTVGVRQGGSFLVSDLTGTWQTHSLAINGISPVWEIGDLSVDSAGNYTTNWEESDGDTGINTGQLSITNGGKITDSEEANYRGIIGLDKNIFVGIDIWHEYDANIAALTVLAMGVRQGGSFSISDLTGTWEIHSLATNGASSGWEIGDLSIDDTGNFTVNWEDSDGDTETDTGQLSITNGGTITDFGVGKFQGIMGLNKNIFVGNDTWDDEAVLTVGVKRDQ